MDRSTIQEPDFGASPLSWDTQDARNSPRGLSHSKSCYEIKSLGLLPRTFSLRTPTFSTSDLRSKSSHNLYSDRKFSDNIVRERHHYGSKEPLITRRSLWPSTAARRRNSLDRNVGRKTSTSTSLGEKHRGLSNHNSLIENRRRRTTSSILHPSSCNSEAENAIDNTISSIVSQSSRNEERRQSSPNIRFGSTNTVSRKRISQSSFNVLSETDKFNAKISSTAAVLETESEINAPFCTPMDSLSCFLGKNAVHASVSTSNHINLASSQNNTQRIGVQNGTVGSNRNGECTKLTHSTLKSFFFCDNVQSRISSPSGQAPHKLDERNKQQEQVDSASKLNKSLIQGIPSCISSFYVKQGALLPLRSHQLLPRQGKESSFENTHNPYYTFLPEFNQSSAESVYKKYNTGSMSAKDSCFISAILPTKTPSICSKTPSFSSGKTENSQKQTNTDASNPLNVMSQGLSNCLTYFQHNSRGNLYSQATNETTPYFNILRALSRMREDARLLKTNNSIFNSTLLCEVQEELSQTDQNNCLELPDSQRHSGTPLPINDIIAKKVSSGIVYQTTEKQSRVLADEGKSKQFVSDEMKLCEASTEGRTITPQIEVKTSGNISENHKHQLKLQDTPSQTHLHGEELIPLRDNEHIATKPVETVFLGPSSSPNDDIKSSNTYQVHAPDSDVQCPEEPLVQQSKDTCSGLTPPFHFFNGGNIASSNLSLLSSDNELPSCTLLERASLNSDLGSSLSEFQYDFPSVRSLDIDNVRRIDTSESLTIQSQPLQRRESSPSHVTSKENFLSGTMAERTKSQNDKGISQVQDTDDGQYLITQTMQPAPKKDSESLPVSSEPMFSRPTSANDSSPKGTRRVGSPKQRSAFHHKQNREQCKLSHSWANRPRIPEEQQQRRQSDREEPLLSTFEGTLDSREIKVRECSKSIIDDRPLVLVSWDESASNQFEGHAESIQGKRSYSLLYWNNTPSETKCTKQNFTNLIKRIMSTISSSVVHIDSKLASESTRSLSAPHSSPSTKRISSLTISSNIKQDSQNRINISKTDNIICAHSISDVGSKKQQVERVTCLPESNNFRPKDQTQNEQSQTIKESFTDTSEDIASYSNKEKSINNNRYEDILKYHSYEEHLKEQLVHSQEHVMQKDEQSGLKMPPVLPVACSSKKLFTQQLQEKDKGKSWDASSTLPCYKGQAVTTTSPTSSNEWSMCIDYPKLPSKRTLYSWWRGKQRSITTYSKLFDSMGMCYLASSDEEISSEDDCNVISWNE